MDTELLLAGEQTVTTASKKTQRVQDVPAAVTVITEEDIRASGAVTLLDLLRSVPGVDVSQPNSSVANVSIRGFNGQFANKLLVMVDGRSIFQSTFGGVFWNVEPLLLSRIKRIEIVRGPGSALYGANAFNGVINIITKTPAEELATSSHTSLRSIVGEQNSQFQELQTSGGKPGGLSYTLGAGYNHTDGLGGRQPGRVRDSYTIPILTMDIEKRLKRGSLVFSAGNSEATADFAQGSIDREDAKWHTSYLMLTYNEDHAKNPILARLFSNSLVQNDVTGRMQDVGTLDLEVQQQRALSKRHNLVYGGNYRHIEATMPSLTGLQAHRQELWALYAQDDFQMTRRTHLFAGIRLDEHSLHGFEFTPRLSLVHHLAADQALRLSYGTAFRNPTIVDSYLDVTLPITPTLGQKITGNTTLKPETVTSYEAGYRKEFARGYVGLNLFYNQVGDLMEYVPTSFAPSPPFPPFTPTMLIQRNTRSATVAGLELEGEWRLAKGIRAFANYSYQDVADSNGARVEYSPRHKFNFGLQAQLRHGLELYMGGHFVGASPYQDSGSTQYLPAYTRIDARIGYRFGKPAHSWTLAVSATNLFDDRHLEYPNNTVPGTPMEVAAQRRTFYVSLTGRF